MNTGGFKRGDRVAWVSQSRGRAKTKRGEVTAVVPAGVLPDSVFRYDVGVPRGLRFYRRKYNWRRTRDHESYLVRVNPPLDKYAKELTRLYWPRPTALRLDDGRDGS